MNRTKEQWAATPYYTDAETGLEAQQDIAELHRQKEELEAEVKEQCRINGMGAERELRLMTERDTLRAQVESLKTDDVIKILKRKECNPVTPLDPEIEYQCCGFWSPCRMPDCYPEKVTK